MVQLEDGAKPVIVTTYRHPKAYKDEIKKAIKELLDMGFIKPSTSLFCILGSFGEEEGWDHENVHRLSAIKQEDYQEPISDPKDRRTHR